MMDGKAIVVSNPGIYNDKDAAFRNAVKQNSEAAMNGNLYVVINNPSVEVIPGLTEVGYYALYDKINSLLGGKLPLTNAEKTNVRLQVLATDTHTKIQGNNHSRGSLVDDISLQYTNNKLGVRHVPVSKTKLLGPAANASAFYEHLKKNDYVDENGISNTLFLASNNSDFVSGIVGGNIVTAGDCVGSPVGKCYSHSSYNGNEEIKPYLTDEKGQPIIDSHTGKEIKNPEFKKINDTVTELKEYVGDNYKNPTIPQAYVVSNNGYIYTVDQNGKATVYDPKSLKPIRTTTIPIHETNGVRYFEFEGRKYHANPSH